MSMPILIAALTALLVLIQYPLWVGKGGWLRAWELDRQVHAQREENERLKERNLSLAEEVKDLRFGQEAIEERARVELGMVKRGEIFVQVVQPESAASTIARQAITAPAPSKQSE